MPPDLHPRRALAHPLWWVALALLAANDHLFKGAGVLPGALTGKLSDFAGLLVAPVLLAMLCGVRRRPGWIAAHVAVGVGFAAINLSPAIARMVEAATLPTPFPWWITVDPTDLVALPMLAVSAVVFARFAARPVMLRPIAARAGVALGGLACVATSAPEPEPLPEPPPDQGFISSASGSIAFINHTGSALVMRTRLLRPEVQVACPLTPQAASAMLHPDLFDAPEIWSIEPGSMLGLPLGGRGATGCGAALIDGPMGRRLVFVDRQVFPFRDFEVRSSETTLPEAVIALRGDGSSLPGHRAIGQAPTGDTVDEEGLCEGPEPGAGLDWTVPPVRVGTVVGHAIGPDGCHAVDIEAQDGGGRWYACTPGVELPIVEGEFIELRPTVDATGEGITVLLGLQGAIRLYRGFALPGGLFFGTQPVPAEETCGAGRRDACDGFVRPLRVVVAGQPVRLGEPVLLDERRDEVITILRAEQSLVVDAACDPWGALGTRFETVTVENPEDAR